MKNIPVILALSLCLLPNLCFSQKQQTENIILITLDGMRWQDLFSGADSTLIDDTGMNPSPGVSLKEFWHEDPLERRKILFPFIWSTIASQGQIYGNRAYGNLVDITNTKRASYPGYNEILTGKADDARILNNTKIPNPNITLLEHLNRLPEFQGKVMAFSSWDRIPYIINREHNGIPVNGGFDRANHPELSASEDLINRLQDEIRGPSVEMRLDPFTHHYALEALKKQQPRFLFLSYGETDEWAHQNRYDLYLKSAKQTDAYIREIWEYVQSHPQYKDKTTLIITTDHGRGTGKTTWRSHGFVPEASQVWMMAIGPDTPASGEMKTKGQWYSAMIARTIFEFLGLEYPDPTAGKVIREMSK